MNARQGTLSIALCLALAMVSGCYHYRVVEPDSASLDDPQSTTKWSFLWGLVQSEQEKVTCACLNNGMKEVTASTNLGYLFLGVVTLGTVVPAELEYVCRKPEAGKAANPPKSASCPVKPGSTGITTLPVPEGQPPAPETATTPSTTAPSAGAPAPAPTSPSTTTPNDPDAGDF